MINCGLSCYRTITPPLRRIALHSICCPLISKKHGIEAGGIFFGLHIREGSLSGGKRTGRQNTDLCPKPGRVRKGLTFIRHVLYLSRFFGAVAQLGERMTGSHEVVGSIPISSTKKAPSLTGLFYFKLETFSTLHSTGSSTSGLFCSRVPKVMKLYRFLPHPFSH